MNKVIKNKYGWLLVSSIFLLSGCASIVHGTRQNETFNTIPNGANITIDGNNHGKSPVTVSLKRNKPHLVDIALPGYQPAQLKLQNTASGWIAGNIVFGGIIGIVVDVMDGAMYKLNPAQLTSLSDSQIQQVSDESVTIVLAKEIPHSMRAHKIGQLKKAS